MSDPFFLSELGRRLHNMVSVGTVTEVDHGRGRLRARIAGRLTGWLPVPGAIGRNWKAWFPIRDGTQVAVTSPSGDPANGVVGQILYKTDQAPPETDPNVDVVVFDDGTTLRYDSGGQILTIATPGKVNIKAAAGVAITAPVVTINGNLEVAGAIHASGSIIDDSGNTPHHNH